MEQEKTKEISQYMALRARQAQPINAEEFHRLVIQGLGALLREVDSIAYLLRNKKGGC